MHGTSDWPHLAEWPSHTPQQLKSKFADLRMEEVDTAVFSPDELCSLALEVFLEACLPQPLDEACVRRLILAARWALRVTDEFYAQGDAERAADLGAVRRAPDKPRRGAAAARLHPCQGTYLRLFSLA